MTATEEKEFDPWALSTGLPDKFRGVIKEAWFTYDSQYQNGETCLLKLEVQSADTEIGDDGRLSILYSCGKKWEPAQKGETVQHEDGKRHPFNQSSAVGQLIAATKQAMGEQDAKARGNPMSGKYWRGLEFDWERKAWTSNFQDEGKKEGSRLLPVRWVGEGKAGSTPTPARAEATPEAPGPVKADPGPAKSGAGGGGGDGMPVALRAKLKVCARNCATHDEFIEKAFGEIDGVMDNPLAESAVMESGPGSIWAEAKA